MLSKSTTIKADCDLPYPRDRVFAHWVSPETRKRWEVGPDTNLSHDGFDTREGGVEVVRILNNGQEVGQMTQTFHGVIENELLASTTSYRIGEETTMLMQLAIEFSDHEGGTRISTLAQAIDLTGANLTDEHKSGWAWIFARFEADIEEHGLIAL